MKQAHWESVLDGTLNLIVPEWVFGGLGVMTPLFFEHPKDIEHPSNPKIPKMRGGYYYHRATASVRGETQEVLVRRPGRPIHWRHLELIAPVKLMDRFQIDEGDEIEVSVEE